MRAACREAGLNLTQAYGQRNNPLYVGLVWKHKKVYQELNDQSYEHLRLLAVDPEVAWIAVGKHDPLVGPDVWNAVQRRYPTTGKVRRETRRVSGLSASCAVPTAET